ncbi:MAG: hypothetical protein H6873_09515 [Hyphomicrobiaceae bacterium]|nr:hypothetical protein [Hyphomicrobiaceae bacterium]
MKIKLLTAAAFGLLMTGAAYATDLAVPAVQMTDPGFDWDGFYAGLTLGGETDFVGGSWVEGGGEAGVIFSLNDNFKVDVSGAFLGYA